MPTSLVTETYDDPLEASDPPRKKQKRGNETKTITPPPPPQTDGLVKEHGGNFEDGLKDIESGNENDSSSVSELGTLARSMAPVQRFSTFNLSRSKVLSETDTEWTIRLHPYDVSMLPISYYVARSEIHLESGNTRPVRYMDSIRRN